MVLIGRLAQPAALALGLAGFTALGLGTKLLMMVIARVRLEKPFAMQTLALKTLRHPAF
jgi:hypothetical protein